MNDRVVLAVEAKSARPGETKLSRLPSPAFGTAAQIACIGWEYELWQVWRVPTALEANGKLFPSFSSLLAHRPVDKAATFALDYSYQTDSIPVYSATDVLSGKVGAKSEEHTSELQSLMRISSDVYCLKTKNRQQHT